MAKISGHVLFDINRTANAASYMQGIDSVPIVLQNIVTKMTLAIYTGKNGAFAFLNVPPGSYKVIQTYRIPAVDSPGDFNTAEEGIEYGAIVSPLHFVENYPPNATNLDCLTPNTVLITVKTKRDDISGVNIINGPIRNIPISQIETGYENLIKEGDGGTFGTFKPGTTAGTALPENPYPNVGSGFRYVRSGFCKPALLEGEFTIQNIINNDIGWRIADCSLWDETGRIMVVGGSKDKATLFEDTVSVTFCTNYLFSCWVANLSKRTDAAEPRLGLQVTNTNGEVLHDSLLADCIPASIDMPEWRQIGALVNSGNNCCLTVKIIDRGSYKSYYAIDDISLRSLISPKSST